MICIFALFDRVIIIRLHDFEQRKSHMKIEPKSKPANHGKFCQTKIYLAYKNWEFYTKSFRLRKEQDRVATTRHKTRLNGIEFPSEKRSTSKKFNSYNQSKLNKHTAT